MRKTWFSKAQVIGVLLEQDAGAATEDVGRRHGVSQQMFYRWKSKYGGMEVSKAQKLEALEGLAATLPDDMGNWSGDDVRKWTPS